MSGQVQTKVKEIKLEASRRGWGEKQKSRKKEKRSAIAGALGLFGGFQGAVSTIVLMI